MLSKRILVSFFLLVFLFLVGCAPSAPPIDENQAPVIVSVPTTNAEVGVSYTYNVEATDPDEDVLTYSLTTRPTDMVINPNTGLITWIPTSSGIFGVIVKVSDGELSVIQSFNILVKVVEDPCVPPCPEPDPCDPPCPPTPQEIKLISIVVVPKTMILFVGETEDIISVTAHYNDGSSFVLGQPYYEYGNGSDDNNVATVSVSHVVTAVAKGTATITVMYEGKTDIIEVTVNLIPPVTLIGIEALPNPISLPKSVGTEQLIVWALYSDGSKVDITLDCVYFVPLYYRDYISLEGVGLVLAQACSGEAVVTVFYIQKGNTWSDVVEVTVFVEALSIVIDGILSSGEWDNGRITEIPVAGGMGTVKIQVTTDYLYVAFNLVDSNDARTQYAGEIGNDQISINVNPTDGGPSGFPYDLIFETSALSYTCEGCSTCPDDGGHHWLPWNPKVNSGTIDNWATRWFPNDAQEDLPGDLESATAYSSTNRITEWKIPLVSLNLSPCGSYIKVGGAVDVGDGNSYKYPSGLNWSDVLTYVEIYTY